MATSCAVAGLDWTVGRISEERVWLEFERVDKSWKELPRGIAESSSQEDG